MYRGEQILTDINIHQMVADRGIDWLIDNTKGIIKRYTRHKNLQQNYEIVSRYSKLLNKLEQLKKDGLV